MCSSDLEFEAKTHSVFIGAVRDVSFRPEGRPLVYLRSAFHDVQAMREPITLGDLKARKMIWSGFS